MPYTFWQNIFASYPILAALFPVLLVWTLVWKGIALWKSARLCHKWWFIALLVINTLGILEILYIYIFSKTAKSQCEPRQ